MLKGKGVSNGIGFGNAIILENEEIKVTQFKIENPEKEIEFFYDAFNKVIEETKEIISKLSGTEADIMQAYLTIMQDPSLITETINMIQNDKYNAGYATEVGFDTIIQMFKSMNDTYMSARSADIEDMKNRILAKIIGREVVNLSNLQPNTIIIAKELTTSDTAKLDFKNISGIITEIGGKTSHVSIMARNHEIPAIVGIDHIDKIFRKNDFIAMNGSTGEIYINPAEEELTELKELKEEFNKEKEELEKYKAEKTVTLDKYKVELVANIGVPDDVEMVIENTAEGIGLFRSEFLYMDSNTLPTEEEQFMAYKQVAENMKGKPVIIRTLDVGGDKDIKYLNLKKEDNPFLGYRAIRISLDNVPLFKTQLRALLRASAFGKICIMLPMISSIEELRAAKEIIEDVKKELLSKDIAFDENIKVGIMIEIPSAALIADNLAQECDFFSIGTNDLIQYTTAVERGNDKIANLYTKYHPAVIKLIKMAIDGAHKSGKFCGMCGEAAGDSIYIPLLLGLGLDEFSMNASKILKARKIISKLEYRKCKELADKALKMSSATEIEKLLVDFNN